MNPHVKNKVASSNFFGVIEFREFSRIFLSTNDANGCEFFVSEFLRIYANVFSGLKISKKFA